MAAQTKPRRTTAKTAAARIEPQKVSVNEVAGRVRGLWLGYLTLGTYLFIAVGAVTHRQLFLAEPIRLPILNVDLPLIGFFAIAPLFFLVNHFYLLLTLLSLGRRIAEYNQALGKENLTAAVENEVRRKLDSFVVVLALAGTQEERTGRTSYLLRTIAWLTVVFTPVILLLFLQLTFLPYHLWWVTWLHRGVLILDLALLWVFWPAIREGEKELPIPMFWQKPLLAVLPVFLGMSSIFLATFPGEPQDGNVIVSLPWIPVWQDPDKPNLIEISSDRRVAIKIDRTLTEEDQKAGFKPFSPYELLFLGKVDETTGKRKSLWSNTLVLPDQDFVDDEKLEKIKERAKEEGKKPWEGERTISLRGRDFRGAVLERVDLRFSDLTGAILDGAKLFEAQLQGASFAKASLREAKFGRTFFNWGAFKGAELQGANLQGANMKLANLGDAKLQGTNLKSARLQGARLILAHLKGANLGYAKMQGANLGGAQMQGANLGGAQMQGADLAFAQMQGADLGGAKMQGANLVAAEMQGANLVAAEMQGANLRFAQMQGADLGWAKIWQVTPLMKTQIEAADLRAIVQTPHDPRALRKMLAGLEDEAVRKRVEKRLAPLLDLDEFAAWAGSPERQVWTDLSLSRPDPAAVTKILGNLACEDDTGGSIIKSIARRLSGRLERVEWHAGFTAAKLLDKENCPAAKHLSEEMLAKLRKIAGPEKKTPEAKAAP